MAASLTLHKVCGKQRRTKAFKSIPARLGRLALAAPAHAKNAWSSVPANTSQPTPGKSKTGGFVRGC